MNAAASRLLFFILEIKNMKRVKKFFVVVSLLFYGQLIASTDFKLSNNLHGIAAANGRVVVVGISPPAAFVSTDGINWIRSGQSFDGVGLEFVTASPAGTFWTGDNSGQIWQSTDGVVWRGPYGTGGKSVSAIGWGPRSAFVGLYDSNYKALVLNTPDGQSFARAFGEGQGGYIYGAAYGNGRWLVTGYRSVANGDSSLWLTSTDGATLSEISPPTASIARGVAFGNGVFVASLGTGVGVTADGVTWKFASNLSKGVLQRVTFNEGLFVVSGENETIMKSADGLSWGVVSSFRQGSQLSYLEALSFGGRVIAISSNAVTVLDGGSFPDLVITQQPQSQIVAAGTKAILSVTAQGRGAVTYQWFTGQSMIAGATSSAYSAGTSGTYSVEVADITGSIRSATATVQVGAPPAVTITMSPTAPVGGSISMSLSPQNATSYIWLKDNAILLGRTSIGFSINPVNTWNAGNYSVASTYPYGTFLSPAKTLSVTSTGVTPALTAKLINLSVRAQASLAQPLIVGFAFSGGQRPILLRAVGPTLAKFGVPGPMMDPTLSLYSAGNVITSNNDWAGVASIADATARLGAFALSSDSTDSVIYPTLSSGVFSAVATPRAGTESGVVLTEAYDGNSSTTGGFINLSTRSVAGNGVESLTTGFVISGVGPRKLLIRGIGPSLRQFGLPNAMSDPLLTLYSATGSVLLTNGSWQNVVNSSAIAAAAAAIGAFTLSNSSLDTSMLVYADPGAYTVSLSSVAGVAGDALIEIYDVTGR